MNYSLVSEEERAHIAPELVGRAHVLVTDGITQWVVKHKPGSVHEEKRDLLGFLLGHSFANVAEVRLLTEEEHLQVRLLSAKDATSTNDNTFLVRVAGSYSIEELPCKTVEQATAAELVYSTWIRRRDAHVYNRSYLNGIPVFYDFSIAFLGEPHLADIARFFALPPTDYGQGGAWKIKLIENYITLLTRGEVPVTNGGGNHYIKDIGIFKEEVKNAIKIIQETMNQPLLEKYIAESNFSSPESETILNFLLTNLASIESDTNLMLQRIF